MSRFNATRARWLLLIAPAAGAAMWFSLTAAQSQDNDRKTLSIFFIGNRQSEIEPCGCVKNQLGGVQFEATLYGQAQREASIRLETGGWTSFRDSPEVSMRTRYALRAMGTHLDMDAVNVGMVDLIHGAEFFKDLGEKEPASVSRLVSANIYYAGEGEKKQRVFAPYKLVDAAIPGAPKLRVAVVGVTAQNQRLPRRGGPDKLSDFHIADPVGELHSLTEELTDQSDILLVVSYGTWADAINLARSNQEIDYLISSSRPPDARQKVVQVGNTRIVGVHNSQGKELGVIQLAPMPDGEWAMAQDPEWRPVSPKLPAVQELVDLIDDYKKSSAELIIKRPRNVKRIFAGAQYCGSCHIEQYKSWSMTRHATALQTLVEKGSQYDPQCLQCHTVGFKQANGFYNVGESRAMANVQCESCHGGGYEHANAQNLIRNGAIRNLDEPALADFLAKAKKLIPPAAVSAETCKQCHQGDNDPNFDFDAKIHHVDHSGSAPPSG